MEIVRLTNTPRLFTESAHVYARRVLPDREILMVDEWTAYQTNEILVLVKEADSPLKE